MTKTFTAKITLAANNAMTKIEGGTKESDWLGSFNIATSGYTPLGIVGFVMYKGDFTTLVANPSLQDCYIGGSKAYFCVQGDGNKAGGVTLELKVLYCNN